MPPWIFLRPRCSLVRSLLYYKLFASKAYIEEIHRNFRQPIIFRLVERDKVYTAKSSKGLHRGVKVMIFWRVQNARGTREISRLGCLDKRY